MATIIVVGGAAGIGRAALQGFRAQSDDVFLVDPLKEAEAALAEDAPGKATFLQRDLADPSVAKEVVAAAVATYGGLDSLLVTAGLMQSAALQDWTAEMFDQSVALNLKMPFLFAQAAAPHLALSSNPSMTFISSTAAVRGHAGVPAYQATKAALPGLCRSLTAELGPKGIRINCILPGWIETPFNDLFWATQPDPGVKRREIEGQIPLRRQGTAEDISSMVLFLASTAGRYIAGASIIIDGGYTAV